MGICAESDADMVSTLMHAFWFIAREKLLKLLSHGCVTCIKCVDTDILKNINMWGTRNQRVMLWFINLHRDSGMHYKN